MLRTLLSLCFCLLLACGSGKGGESASVGETTATSTGTGTSTGVQEPPPLMCPEPPALEPTTGEPAELCPDQPATDACCCFEDLSADHTSTQGTRSVCPLAELCPTIELVCDDSGARNCPTDHLTVMNEDAIDCALQALAAGASGRIAWNIDDMILGLSHEDIELDLVGDGTVFRHGRYHYDLCWETLGVERRMLPPASFFADCLDAPAWQTRFDCVRAAQTCATLETCIAGYSFTPMESPRRALQAVPLRPQGCARARSTHASSDMSSRTSLSGSPRRAAGRR